MTPLFFLEQDMKHNRDYEMPCEENLASRIASSASVEDGLAFRVTAQKPGAAYRTYHKADGSEDHGKKYRGTMYEDDGMGLWSW